MPNNTFPRSIFHQRHLIRKKFNVLHYNAARNITAATTAEKYDDPALASAKPYHEMPSLLKLPFIGSSWVYFPVIGRYNLRQLHKADIDKHNIFGDIVREKFGALEVVSSFVPETMELLFRHEGQYPSRGEITTLKAYRESRKHWYKSSGMMVLHGHEWQDLRSKTQKHIMKPRAIQAYLEPMQEVARDFITLIQGKRDSNKEVPEFIENLYKWALESVAYVGLDTRLGCLNPDAIAGSDGQKMIDSVQTQFHCMNELEAFTGNFPFWKYFPTPTWKKFEKAGDIFTEIAFKYINLSLANLKRKKDDDMELTLLQSLLTTKGLDISGAMVTVADMLMAGIDTTSNTLGFFFYDMAKNPEKQEKLYREIQGLLPRKEDNITLEIFNKLHYLKACMKESIRMHPIIRGIARRLDHDVVISGYRVPAGTIIACMLQICYKDEKYFKNADNFFPERWLTKEEKPKNPYAYAPFGIGTRSCIGRRLAELEMICLATQILRNFKLEYQYEDLDMLTRLVNVPDKPLRFNFLDR